MQRADMISPALTNIRGFVLPGEVPDPSLAWPPKPHAPPRDQDEVDEDVPREPREQSYAGKGRVETVVVM